MKNQEYIVSTAMLAAYLGKKSSDCLDLMTPKEEFSAKAVTDVKLSDAKIFLIKLQRDGRGYSSIHSIRGGLRPAFQMAVDDDLILKNPFQFELGTIIVNDSKQRDAVQPKDEEKFLSFVKEDSHYAKYYDAFLLLFKTGMRISEFCGLTVRDMDFENGVINIDYQLQRTRQMKYVIESTKTTCGTRKLPMTDEIREVCDRMVKNRKKPKKEPLIDGYGGFLYMDKNGRPMVALHWEKYMQHAVEKYNREHPIQLPPITPHICRYTYCSNQAKAGMNPKTLQYLMGHSDIAVTLNVYTHLGLNDAIAELVRMGAMTAKEEDSVSELRAVKQIYLTKTAKIYHLPKEKQQKSQYLCGLEIYQKYTSCPKKHENFRENMRN